MKELKKILMVVLIGAVLATTGLAQGDKRPPKDQPKVVDKEKDKTPPPKNPPPPDNNNKKKP